MACPHGLSSSGWDMSTADPDLSQASWAQHGDPMSQVKTTSGLLSPNHHPEVSWQGQLGRPPAQGTFEKSPWHLLLSLRHS